MSSRFSPDRWVVVEITDGGELYRRILATWNGGFAGADTWRMSSKISDLKIRDHLFTFTSETGSVYLCNTHCYGMSPLGLSVFSSFDDQLENSGGGIRSLTAKEVLKLA